MKLLPISKVCFVTVFVSILAACGPSASTSTPSNFAFYFEYGVCFREKFDSFNSIFIHDMGPFEPSITVPLTLSEEEMSAIRQKMMEIDFFNYPDIFLSTPVGKIHTGIDPHPRYFLRVRDGDTIKSVSWEDEIVSSVSQETENLRQLIKMIIAIIESHPEVKNLPEPAGGCL